MALQTEAALTRRLREDEEAARERELASRVCDKHATAQTNRVLAEKQAKLAEKRRHNMERKKSAVSSAQKRNVDLLSRAAKSETVKKSNSVVVLVKPRVPPARQVAKRLI